MKLKIKHKIVAIISLISYFVLLFMVLPQQTNATVTSHFDVDTWHSAHVVQSPLTHPHSDLLIGHYLENTNYEVKSENMGAYYSGIQNNPLAYCVAINYGIDAPYVNLPGLAGYNSITYNNENSAKYAYLIHTYGQSGSGDTTAVTGPNVADTGHAHMSQINNQSMYMNNAAIHYNLRQSIYEANPTRWTSLKTAYSSTILSSIATLADQLMTDAIRNYGPYTLTATLSNSSTTNRAVLSYVITAASGETFTGKRSNGTNHVVKAEITSGNATFTDSTTSKEIYNGSSFPEIVYTSGTTGKIKVSLSVENLPGTTLTIRTTLVNGVIDTQSMLTANTNVKATITAAAELDIPLGSVKIQKRGYESNDTMWNDKYSLAGNVFHIYPGTTATGTPTAILTTNASGYAAVGNLPLGTYTLAEATAGPGFVINPTTYTFTLPTAGGSYGINVTFPNEEKKGNALLEKVDAETGTTPQGDATLNGAEFALFHADDDEDDSNDLPVKTTDAFSPVTSVGTGIGENDEIVVRANGRNIQVNHLALGDYYWIETKAPTGYLLNAEKIPFSVTTGATTTVTINNQAMDTVIKGKITGIKKGSTTDGSEKPLLSGIGITATLKSDSTKTYTTTTGNDGSFVLNNLPYGTYTVTETQGKVGYKLFAPFDVVVNENGANYHYTAEVLDEIETTSLNVKKNWSLVNPEGDSTKYKVTFDLVRYTENEGVKVLDNEFIGQEIVLDNASNFETEIDNLPTHSLDGKEYIYAITNEKVWDTSKAPEEDVTGQFNLELTSANDELTNGVVFDLDHDTEVEITNVEDEVESLPLTGGIGIKEILLMGMTFILLASIVGAYIYGKKIKFV